MFEDPCTVEFLKAGNVLSTKITSPVGTIVTVEAFDTTGGQLQEGIETTFEVLKGLCGPEGAMSAMKQLAGKFEEMRAAKN